jgi:hypothetical protein
MANKTVAQLQKEFDKVSTETQKAYDVLHPTFGSDARQIAYEYEKAVKEKDDKAIAKLKPAYDKAQAAYNDAQNRKNSLRKELETLKQEELNAKKATIAEKSTGNAYDNTLKDLAVAEAKINAYNGQENYIAAYRKAQEAFTAAQKAGKTVTALPSPKVEIPVIVEDVKLGPDGKPLKEPTITEFIATITDPKNKQQLIDVQKDLAANFGYKGPIDGSPSSKFMPALQKAYTDRAGLPEAWRGTDFRTFLSSPNVEGTAGTGTSGKYDPYATLAVWDKTKTKSELTTLFNNLGIDRDPTAKEVNDIYAQIDKKQKEQKATVTKYKMINGVRTAITTPGFNQGEFVTDLVKGTQEYKDIVAKKAKQEESKNLVAAQTLRGVADKNGIALSQEQLDTFASRVSKGEDISLVQNDIRKLAAIGQPDSVKKLIESGIDLSTIYSPYKSLLAQTLEINPNSISMNDPTLRMAIGPDKEMSLYEYQRALRKDNRWQYTNQARSEASDVAKTVLKDFGFMG